MIGRKRRFTPSSSLTLNLSTALVLGLLVNFTGNATALTRNAAPPGPPELSLSLLNGIKGVYNYILPYVPFSRLANAAPGPTSATTATAALPTSTAPATATATATALPTPTVDIGRLKGQSPNKPGLTPVTAVPPTATAVPPPARPGGLYGPLGPATISRAVFVNWVYEFPGSAARGEAGAMYDALIATGTDPAIFAGFAVHESTVATYGASVPNRNIVNISCMYSPCAGRWQIFPSFAAGTRAWGQLMHKYATGEICGRPKVTLDEILYCYAPAFENPTAKYIGQVKYLADRLRSR